ncbi:MAG: MarR family transcriptional regulator [Erysipelotrichaceae bacterium]|nr:MarR family transcriptional regulator [Erysipelotrichaceae bacterium]
MNTPLHILLFKVFHLQRKKMRSDMKRYGLFPGQPKVLRYINVHENCKLSDIARECDIECATASKLLEGLAESGMLERSINTMNKRALQINITDKGKHALSLWELHCKEIEKIAMQDFTEAEIERFKQDIQRIYNNLSKISTKE